MKAASILALTAAVGIIIYLVWKKNEDKKATQLASDTAAAWAKLDQSPGSVSAAEQQFQDTHTPYGVIA